MPEPVRPDAPRALLPVVAVAGLVGVAATGAGLLLPAADPGPVATAACRGLGVAAATAGAAALVTRRARWTRVEVSQLLAVLAAGAAVLAAVTCVTYLFSPVTRTTPGGSSGGGAAVTVTTSTTVPATTTTEPDDDRPPALDVPVGRILQVLVYTAVAAALLVALVALAGRARLASWRRGAVGVQTAPGRPLDLRTAEQGLEASLAALTTDRAPRDAISDAYAVLLDALEAAGAGRRAQEAPHEHLDRVLTPLGVRPAPLHRLAELFVLARFSQHPVTPAHRDDAVAALRAALADLEATTAAGAPGASRTPGAGATGPGGTGP